jgi:hypothetical protein
LQAGWDLVPDEVTVLCTNGFSRGLHVQPQTTRLWVSGIIGFYVSDPSPLCMAFPRSLGGREPTDYRRPVCPTCPCCIPGTSPFAGKVRWFLGSCLVTGMGLGWLPNTFSLTESLRTEFFTLAGARTY